LLYLAWAGLGLAGTRYTILLVRFFRKQFDVSVIVKKEKTMASPNLPKGSVFDRLYDTRSYTGVYAERFKGADGRINAHTDLSVVS
jgi:hypothetical protein